MAARKTTTKKSTKSAPKGKRAAQPQPEELGPILSRPVWGAIWGIVGLLHDIDFELYPAEHCLKAPELLREDGVSEDIIHGVVSHGYGITIECGVTLDVEPVHEMEKVLFAADELTGLIWAAALMRPSKSTKDMELKSLKKKYKSKGFAAGCSREVIERGADQLGWPLEKLLTMTLQAMADSEDEINREVEAEQGRDAADSEINDGADVSV